MKEMMSSLSFKPAGIKDNCENETKYHKVKIVGFSVLMAAVATSYQTYFNDLVYRSGIYQQRALAGQESFASFVDGEDPATLWQIKNEVDVLDSKPFKELKYMQTGSYDSSRLSDDDYHEQQGSNEYKNVWPLDPRRD